MLMAAVSQYLLGIVRPKPLFPRLQARKVSCNASSARFFVGGNWKCNGSRQTISDLVKELNSGRIPGA